MRYIDSSLIKLGGSSKKLKRLGLKSKIKHSDTKPSELNEELISIMLKLRELGVAYSYDYKVYWSPNVFMEILQEKGRLNHEFTETSWKGSGRWILTTHEVE